MDANFAGGLTLIFVMGYCSIHSAAHIKRICFGDHIRPRLCYSSFMGMSLGVEVFLNVGAGQDINDQIISVLRFYVKYKMVKKIRV